MPEIEVIEGDIAAFEVDAIVNAANRSLPGGGGVDGAIRRAAGPWLPAECRGLGGCGTGQAKVTGGHGLRARHVIRTVGPVWRGGDMAEDDRLVSCYRESLARASEIGHRRVAFPAISTGIYGFPADRAARIAVATIRAEARARGAGAAGGLRRGAGGECAMRRSGARAPDMTGAARPGTGKAGRG
ncbi:macro domain-containing protein [Roseibacterium sp. SDUM158017]|uniref:macro domain-containing protein n=1 Tax=Roseicyclus salinarum TaxID=3036773 RepID=UPI002414E505|nr:macro domain-containing protein [Roseibacterium sp. SDUM158017]MDG4649108.1 macro domain-containing protein [Roseibacterium sp. SDUM158017]